MSFYTELSQRLANTMNPMPGSGIQPLPLPLPSQSTELQRTAILITEQAKKTNGVGMDSVIKSGVFKTPIPVTTKSLPTVKPTTLPDPRFYQIATSNVGQNRPIGIPRERAPVGIRLSNSSIPIPTSSSSSSSSTPLTTLQQTAKQIGNNLGTITCDARRGTITPEALLQQMEAVQQAEKAMNQAQELQLKAQEVTRREYAGVLDHVEISVPPSIHNPGRVIYYDAPNLTRAKTEEQAANKAYNEATITFAQEKAKLGHMQREISPGWNMAEDATVAASGGIVTALLKLFSF